MLSPSVLKTLHLILHIMDLGKEVNLLFHQNRVNVFHLLGIFTETHDVFVYPDWVNI